MSVKGSWARSKDREKFDRKKERIFMDTMDLADALGLRLDAPNRELTGEPLRIYMRFATLAYDIGIMPDNDRSDSAKAIRRELMELHEQLDEEDE